MKKEDKSSQDENDEECEANKDSESKESKENEPEEKPDSTQAGKDKDDVIELPAEKDNNFETDGKFLVRDDN